jgi:hypothetical protein
MVCFIPFVATSRCVRIGLALAALSCIASHRSDQANGQQINGWDGYSVHSTGTYRGPRYLYPFNNNPTNNVGFGNGFCRPGWDGWGVGGFYGNPFGFNPFGSFSTIGNVYYPVVVYPYGGGWNGGWNGGWGWNNWNRRIISQQSVVNQIQAANNQQQQNIAAQMMAQAAQQQAQVDAQAEAIDEELADLTIVQRRVRELRRSDQAGRTKAQRIMTAGDQYFQKRDFRRAAAKYRAALNAAPDLPALHLRQSLIGVATKNYDAAVNDLMVSLEISKGPNRADLRLSDLYQGRVEGEKGTHLNDLSDEALQHPDDGSLLLLVGAMLFFDGQADRAQVFLNSAAEAAGIQRDYAVMFQ